MSQTSPDRLNTITDRITRAAHGRPVTLVAVSKTFGADEIKPVLDSGQRVFGENRVQEAKAKWPALRQEFSGVELHLIGPLQTNKVDEAAALFDVIQTLDRPKLASALSKAQSKSKKILRCFVQVNIGREPQKAGVSAKEADGFIRECREIHGLNIMGLMCIPPEKADPRPYFSALRAIAERNGLQELSMGMSGDFEAAIAEGATLVRVGSAIFGQR